MSDQRSKGRFLTDGDKGQRAYLSGKYEPETDNAEYQVRSKIRARTEGALSELDFISKNIPERDLKKIFEDWSRLPESTPDGDKQQFKMPQQLSTVEAIIGMAYRGYRLNGMEANEFIKSVVENAIRKAEADRKGVDPNRNVSIELDLQELTVHTDPDELDPLEKWENGLALSRDEQQQLFERLSDKLDREISLTEVGDLIDEHLVESDGE
jgi:hypothetical protein